MTTEIKRAHVTNYEGTDITVDEHGYFYATPPGCRKERREYSIGNLKTEIRKVIDRSRQKKRKDVNYPVAIFDQAKGHVDVNAKYVGVRGKASDYLEAGHVIELNGNKRNTDSFKTLRVVPKCISQDTITDLENAHELLRAAQEDYRIALNKATVGVKLAHVGTYEPTATQLIQDQEKATKKFQDAYTAGMENMAF
jgi:hypothetical protein